MSTNTIEIKKKTIGSEAVTCWKVPAIDVTPNTVIAADAGITVIVKINGKSCLAIGGVPTIVNSLLNPGKGNKIFGGNKAYEKVEIYAVDQASSFQAEWALAGANAMPYQDPDYDVAATVIARGVYEYTIDNFLNFTSTMAFQDGVITRSAVREYLRAKMESITKPLFAAKLSEVGLAGTQAETAKIAKKVTAQLNDALDANGITVTLFGIQEVNYAPTHMNKRRELDEIKMGNAAQTLLNSRDLGKIGVKDADSDVYLKVRKGEAEADAIAKGYNRPAAKEDKPAKADKPTEKVIFCPQCGKKNENAKFCSGCGARLPE